MCVINVSGIDVCYKCIRDLIWMSMEPLHGHRRAFINAHEIAPLKTVIESLLT